MDYIRLTPSPKMVIVSKVAGEDTGEEPRELFRIPVTSSEDIARETTKLVSWALQMAVGVEVPSVAAEADL